MVSRQFRFIMRCAWISMLCCGGVSPVFGRTETGPEAVRREAGAAPSGQQPEEDDPSKGKILGLVTDRDGRPLAGAKVIVIPEDACDDLVGEAAAHGGCPLEKLGELVSTLSANESLAAHAAELGGRVLVTDLQGAFVAGNLKPGNFVLAVGRLGLRPVTQSDIPVVAGGILEVRIILDALLEDP